MTSILCLPNGPTRPYIQNRIPPNHSDRARKYILKLTDRVGVSNTKLYCSPGAEFPVLYHKVSQLCPISHQVLGNTVWPGHMTRTGRTSSQVNLSSHNCYWSSLCISICRMLLCYSHDYQLLILCAWLQKFYVSHLYR